MKRFYTLLSDNTPHPQKKIDADIKATEGEIVRLLREVTAI